MKPNDEEAEAGELVEATAHDAHYKNQEATYLECEGAESEFDGGMGGFSRHALPKKGEADLPDDARRRKVEANEGNVGGRNGGQRERLWACRKCCFCCCETCCRRAWPIP